MERRFAFLAVFLLGYSLTLGQYTDQDNSTTSEPIWNETWASNTPEQNMSFATSDAPITTNQETNPVTGSTSGPPSNSSDLPYNETIAGNNATSQGPPLNGTGSLSSSSSLTDGPKPMGGSDGQRFDTASFVGGIVLAVGVIALGIFLVKVYQSRRGPRAEYNNI